MFGSRANELEERIERLERKISSLECDLKFETSAVYGEVTLRSAVNEILKRMGIEIHINPAQPKRITFVNVTENKEE